MYGLVQGPLLCASIRFILQHAKTSGQTRDGADGRSEATAIVVRRLGLCREGVGHRLVSGVVSALRRYQPLPILLRFALFYSPYLFFG